MNVQKEAKLASFFLGEGCQVNLSPLDTICISKNNYFAFLKVIYRTELKNSFLESESDNPEGCAPDKIM